MVETYPLIRIAGEQGPVRADRHIHDRAGRQEDDIDGNRIGKFVHGEPVRQQG